MHNDQWREKLKTLWRDDSAWQEFFVTSVTRELSKTGDLDAHDEVLCELSASLPKTEAISLYKKLQESLRPDSEWRNQFLRIFPIVSEMDLPMPIIDDEEAKRLAAEDRARAQAVGTHKILPDEDIPF